jgi:hypothetical protein
MKLLAILAAGAMLSVTVHAQTAKVIALKPEDAAHEWRVLERLQRHYGAE